jgi:N-acetylmuramoyl-L-alanine amidase
MAGWPARPRSSPRSPCRRPAAAQSAVVPAARAAGQLQQEFAAAAAQYQVPVAVLLGVSYQESLWEENGGQPRYAGGYGPMNLTDLTQALLTKDGFSGDAERTSDLLNSPALHTLPAAAYSQGTEPFVARLLAQSVYATIKAGATRTTSDGQVVTLQADPGVHPRPATVRRLHLQDVTIPRANPTMDPPQIPKPECPASLHCIYSPSGYWQYGSSKGFYGDHDLASRPKNLQIRYITLHDNEETGDGTLWLFHDPTYLASANYEVFSDGTVVQLVPDEDIAWDSGNPAFYQHSIGIEREGFAIHGATWYTPQPYRATARLVRYLTAKYGIPRDRAHILGHNSIPGENCDVCIASQHWDPGRTGTGAGSCP